MSRSASIKVCLNQSNALKLHKKISLLKILLYFSAIIKPVSIGMYSFDVIYDVITSMKTLKHGTPRSPYPDVYTDTLIFFSDHCHDCEKLYG